MFSQLTCVVRHTQLLGKFVSDPRFSLRVLVTLVIKMSDVTQATGYGDKIHLRNGTPASLNSTSAVTLMFITYWQIIKNKVFLDDRPYVERTRFMTNDYKSANIISGLQQTETHCSYTVKPTWPHPLLGPRLVCRQKNTGDCNCCTLIKD